jgi:cytosine/adenosine deaminase-related metal-dependent hydrolase
MVVENCAIATVDRDGAEHASGHLVVEGERIVAVGPGPAPADPPGATVRRIDGDGCPATPGLVNCHHHLYQWITRGLAQQANLFDWLTELYPVWSRLDGDLELAAARAALAALLTSGCSTSTDHHHGFPSGAGDLLAPAIEAATSLGIRFHPTRGSMDLGRSRGGLPPDELVEDRDTGLAATKAAIDRWHDPGPGAMLRSRSLPAPRSR